MFSKCSCSASTAWRRAGRACTRRLTAPNCSVGPAAYVLQPCYNSQRIRRALLLHTITIHLATDSILQTYPLPVQLDFPNFIMTHLNLKLTVHIIVKGDVYRSMSLPL